MDKINFFLPEFYGNFRLITYLHDWMQDEPQYFYEDVRIAAVYGCFPGNIWNGGRVILGSATRTEIAHVIEEYNRRGIAIRYTYTNPLLERYHVLDTYCNMCMDMADNGLNEVLVNSPALESYLREAYPGYRFISSTTKCLGDIEAVREELNKDYYLVVLDSALNNTEEMWELAPKEKIELIANHYCADNCPRRREHYKAVAKAQLEYDDSLVFKCENIKRSFQEIQTNCSFISNEDIHGAYREAGFVNFKLDGRGFKRFKVLESFVYYLVKPEYRDFVRNKISDDLYGRK